MSDAPSWRLWAALYPFGVGAAAVNLYFAALIAQTLGWRVLTPYEALAWGALLGAPTSWYFARHIVRLIKEAERR